MPLQSISRALARLRDGSNRGAVCRLGLYALPLALLTAVLVLVPITLRLEAKGRLMPLERQMVYANQNGKVVEVRAHPGTESKKARSCSSSKTLKRSCKLTSWQSRSAQPSSA